MQKSNHTARRKTGPLQDEKGAVVRDGLPCALLGKRQIDDSLRKSEGCRNRSLAADGSQRQRGEHQKQGNALRTLTLAHRQGVVVGEHMTELVRQHRLQLFCILARANQSAEDDDMRSRADEGIDLLVPQHMQSEPLGSVAERGQQGLREQSERMCHFGIDDNAHPLGACLRNPCQRQRGDEAGEQQGDTETTQEKRHGCEEEGERVEGREEKA